MAPPKTVGAPAPHATTNKKTPSAKVHVPLGPKTPHHAHVDVVHITVHNWVQLVYEAFGADFPTDPHELALLGVRTGRSKSTPKPGSIPYPKPPPKPAPKQVAKPGATPAPKAAAPPVKKDTDADVEERETEDATGEAVTYGADPVTYGDLLYATTTTSTNNDDQIVQVFECLIDATKLTAPAQPDPATRAAMALISQYNGGPITRSTTEAITKEQVDRAIAILHSALDVPLPDLLEGQCFTGRPGSYLAPSHPGKFVLRLKTQRTETRPEDVVKLARSECAAWAVASKAERTDQKDKYNKGEWCAPFVTYCMNHAEHTMPVVDYAWTPDGVVAFKAGAWGLWIEGGWDLPEPGDVTIVNTTSAKDDKKWDHTGLCVDVRDVVDVDDIEGNTTPTGQSGSDNNGDALATKGRLNAPILLAGFGRPRWAPIIRWGDDDAVQDTVKRSDGVVLRRATVGHTVLHHHYYTRDPKTKALVDPAAEAKKAGNKGAKADPKKKARYQVFLDLINAAPKSQQDKIPYLVVSTNYVLTYPEWAEVAKKMTPPLQPQSVIRTEKLVAPQQWPDHYLPSFLTLDEVNNVIEACRKVPKQSQDAIKHIDEQLKHATKDQTRALNVQRAVAAAAPAHAAAMLQELKDSLLTLSFNP